MPRPPRACSPANYPGRCTVFGDRVQIDAGAVESVLHLRPV